MRTDGGGDGSAKVVVHDDMAECFGDGTFTRSRGRWRNVSAGIYGSTA